MSYSIFRPFFSLSVTFLLLTLCLFGVNSTGAVAAVSLGGPDVSKLDWNVRSMEAADINRDGFNDIAVINNDTVSIEILYQLAPGEPVPQDKRRINHDRWEPVLEDARFYKESVVIGFYLYAMRVGDLNSDGLPDFVYTGNNEPLTINYQTQSGEWKETWTYDDLVPQQWISTLLIDDFNGDDRNDLLVLTVDKLLLFHQNKEGEMMEPEIYLVSEDNAHGLAFTDIDGDGRKDICFLAGSSERSLHFRLAGEQNNFGPELRFVLDTSAPHIQKWASASSPESEKSIAEYLYIQAKTRMLRYMHLEKETGPVADIEDLQPRTYSAENTDNSRIYYARGDFNGDGLHDLAGGDSTGARLLLYFQNAQGDFNEPVSYPSLNNISGLASLSERGEARDVLIVMSEKEKIIGISRFSEKGRLEFPRIIPIEGIPVAMNCLDGDGDGDDEILLVEKNNRKYRLLLIDKESGKKRKSGNQSLNWISQAQELGGLRRDPVALFPVNMDSDNLKDLLVLIPKEPPLIFVQNKPTKKKRESSDQGEEDAPFNFTEVAVDSAIRKGMLSDLQLSRLGSGDIDGDGIDELIVADTGFARSFEIDEEGKLIVVDQYNAKQSDDHLRSPIVMDLNNDKNLELVFYDSANQAFQWLVADEAGVFRYEKSVEVGSMNLEQGMVFEETLPENRKMGIKKAQTYPHILLFGSDRFWSIPLNQKGFKLETSQAYQCDLKDVRYTNLLVGDLNNDNRNEIVTLDGQNHLLEILEQQADGEFKSVLHFTVFEDNMHYQGRKGAAFEPREILISDFTGDGKNDLAMLIHDRLLIYYQE